MDNQNSQTAGTSGPLGLEVSLPGGFFIADKLVQNVTIGKITGRVHLEIGKAEVKESIYNIIMTILRHCVKKVGDRDPNSGMLERQNAFDSDILLMKIREYSGLKENIMEATCSCGHKMTIKHEIADLKFRDMPKFVKPNFTDQVFEFEYEKEDIGLVRGVVPTRADQRMAFVKNSNPIEVLYKLVAKSIKTVDGKAITLDELLDKDGVELQRWTTILQDISWGYDMNLKVNCNKCGIELGLDVQPGSFFSA